jgi:hypothetical protein
MIADLDETLKQLLIKEGGLDPAEVDISFDMPDREWSSKVSKPTVNLYLYDVHEKTELRRNDWQIEHANGRATKRKPPPRVDLSYLITVWTNDIADQHRLLGHLLAVLFRHKEYPEGVLQGKMKSVEWPIHTMVAQPDGVLRNSADFWSALDNQLKPSISYVVTVPVEVDLVISGPEVKTKVLQFKDRHNGPTEETVQISGIIHRKGDPEAVVSDATIVMKELQRTAKTGRDGKYTFGKVSRGSHTFEVMTPEEEKREVSVSVPSASYDIEL